MPPETAATTGWLHRPEPAEGTRPGLGSGLWAAPAAVASFALYHLTGLITRATRSVAARRRPERARSWRALGPELLDDPLGVVEMATLGPRWNPHATIGVAGPFPVRARLSIDLETLRRAAPDWTLVVYRFPRYRTVAAVASGRCPESSHTEVDLPPGRYALGLRYYRPARGARFPEVRIDPDRAGERRVPPRPAPENVAELYRRLARKGEGGGRGHRLLHRALAHHVLVLLRFRDRLPPRLVERILLPVGNPETRFEYGLLEPGETVEVTPPSDTVRGTDPYLTVYGPDSLPRQWCRVPAAGFRTRPLAAPGFFVLRLHPRGDGR